MRLIPNTNPEDRPEGARTRIKFGVVSGSAIIGALIAGSWAPTILQAIYTELRSWLRVQPTITNEGPTSVRPHNGQSKTSHAAGDGKTSQVLAPNSKGGDITTKIEAPIVDDRATYSESHSFFSILPFVVAGALLGAYIGNKVMDFLVAQTSHWNKLEAGDKVTIVLGVVVGVVMSIPFYVIFSSFQISVAYVPWLVLLLTLGTITLSVYILQSISEFFPWNRGRGPMRRTGIKVLDTNVIIDGRIYDVAQNGFLEGQLYVPQFVIEELQHIADHHDALKRQRGKRGLEVLRHLQAEFALEVGTHDRLITSMADPVDTRLVKLARAIGADLVTNDHNLNRVAALQEVRVLNLNDLALALRPNVLPQETLNLTIIREGNQPGQGVGYLDDGTMVVIENGKNHIGETLDIEVTQVIQTERGKMIFGEVDCEPPPDGEPPRKRSSTPRR